MSRFKDATGREWTLRINVGVIERVREIDVDLGDITAQTMKRLGLDDVLLVRSLWLICEEQADDASITAEKFGESLVGDCIDDAYAALRGALEDFFPKKKREFFRQMMEAEVASQTEAMELGLAALTENKAEASAAMQERITAEVKNALTRLRSATN